MKDGDGAAHRRFGIATTLGAAGGERRGPWRAGGVDDERREELVALRRETKRLRMERDILKKATAFFAKELHQLIHDL